MANPPRFSCWVFKQGLAPSKCTCFASYSSLASYNNQTLSAMPPPPPPPPADTTNNPQDTTTASKKLCTEMFCRMYPPNINITPQTAISPGTATGGEEQLSVRQKMISLCKLSSLATTKPQPPNVSISSIPLPPPSPTKTFYRRELPSDLVSFTSAAGRKLFKESLNEGFAEGYFNLAGNFTVQSEPAYCGPSSLAMVLNALEVDPGRTWKGVWRWYSDELLESCRTESDLKANGITYDQFLCLASSHAQVVSKRGRTATREEFLRDIKYVTQRDDVFMVLSFSRRVLGQTGDGHFSPIGAYHSGTNMALVLDSARYKYPSWFGDVDKLYDSLQPDDKETGLPRGYFLISRANSNVDLKKECASGCKTGNECAVVDLPERPVDVLPTRLSCGSSSSSPSGKCCSSSSKT